MYDFENNVSYGKSQLLEEVKKNTSVCPECGQTFQQGFRINKKTGEKIFNKYKYCPKCRKELSKKQRTENDKCFN